MTAIVVIAKECLPGKVKTRLHPPLSLEQAAFLAAASLADTLAVAGSLPATRRILAFDGVTAPAEAFGWEVLPQTGGGLDERLAAIFDHLDEPTLLLGMDTPQVSAELLAPVFLDWNTHLRSNTHPYSGTPPDSPPPPDSSPPTDAWFGPADDGGFWALALKNPTGALLRGIPMSRADTGAHQLQRLDEAGLSVRLLPSLTDIDTIADAHTVALAAPHTRFARAFNRVRTAAQLDTADLYAADLNTADDLPPKGAGS
ncbi:MAG: DUF2064 domain-containing protein [Cryobacterium sp.]|uniref:TIGR04282 family arsenosugar biosynthesis glycosyltransferase n=1 Tax=unclassified Cryobacterium TaxID=2649013 RepID=UPI0018CBD246|nr:MULTISPECIES: DUF2064 domain-containing protein [unclassified Cryobacterium]MCY7403887.1 DUF2064 domain-containing protein [Cryobacterium sp.]MEC5155799.1 glycosyltransferase A (GT-A) superfamily protein (DUF2064 family) [Cryobacterium sp. CAN_C3]